MPLIDPATGEAYQQPYELIAELRDEIDRLRASSGKVVTESIFSGSTVVIPLADVQHIESHATNTVPGMKVITKHTRWDADTGDWANAIWISEPEATAFRRAWCRYRSELEADDLADLEPNEYVRPDGQFGMGA